MYFPEIFISGGFKEHEKSLLPSLDTIMPTNPLLAIFYM